MAKSEQQNFIDFNIHGIVAIRFIDPDPEVVRAFERRYSPVLASPAGHTPDILVNFEADFYSTDLVHAGDNSTGFSQDAFYLLDRTTGVIQAEIPFDAIGNHPEITYSRQANALPLLNEIILFTFLSKGYIPVHASAFVYEGTGMLVAGWPKGGKTGALLSFMNHGAQFVGDEWILISRDLRSALGLPNPVTISAWQFKYIPGFAPKIKLSQRLFFSGIRAIDALHNALQKTRIKRAFGFKLLEKALPALKKQLKVSKSPGELFKNQAGSYQAVLDKICLILGHSQPDIHIEQSNPVAIALRMVQANAYELRGFLDLYTAFKFAYPHRQNDFLENAFDRQSLLLRQALGTRETYTVYHPYGGALDLLFAKISSLCFRSNQEASSGALLDVSLAPTYEEVL